MLVHVARGQREAQLLDRMVREQGLGQIQNRGGHFGGEGLGHGGVDRGEEVVQRVQRVLDEALVGGDEIIQRSHQRRLLFRLLGLVCIDGLLQLHLTHPSLSHLVHLITCLCHHVAMRVSVQRNQLVTRLQLLQQVLVLHLTPTTQHHIRNRRLFRVVRRLTSTQVVQHLASLPNLAANRQQRVVLCLRSSSQSAYNLGIHLVLYRSNAVVEVGGFSPDIDLLAVLFCLIFQLLHVAENAAIGFSECQQLLLLCDRNEIPMGYIHLQLRKRPTRKTHPAIPPPSPTWRFLHRFEMCP